MSSPETDVHSPIRPGTETPFTRAMATDMGIRRRDLYGPKYRPVLRGIFIDRRIPDSLVIRARAGLLVAPPGGILSHFTAACLWSASAPSSSRIHLSYVATKSVSRPEIAVHRFTYPFERAARHGLPVTRPTTTFMHLAVHLDLVELVAFGDMIIKRKVITVEELRSYARVWTHHGYRLGRQAADLARERVDSVPETHLRLLLVLAGLPEPRVNPWVHDELGNRVYRLDLAYPEIKLAVEYDGKWHEEEPQRLKDELRREWLRQRGWRVVVVRAKGLYQRCDDTLAEVEGALTDRGLVLSPRSPEYLRHFGQVLSVPSD